MPWHNTDCQAALVSELHWLHRGNNKRTAPFAAPSTRTYLFNCTILSLTWLCCVRLQCELRIPLLSRPIPSELSRAFVSALWGFFRFQCLCAMPYQQSENALSTPTLSSCCSVKDKHPASLLLQMSYATAVELSGLLRRMSLWRLGVLPTVNRITGSSQLQRTPLFTFCSGSECFPHLHT